MLVCSELGEVAKSGTCPEVDVSQVEVDKGRPYCLQIIAQTQLDYEQKSFVTYMEYTTCW
jgi:hypothetical protein